MELDFRTFKNEINQKTDPSYEACTLSLFLRTMYPYGGKNEYVAITGKSTGSVLAKKESKGFQSGVNGGLYPEFIHIHNPYEKKEQKEGMIRGELPESAKYDYIWESGDYDGRVLTYPVSKIIPKRKNTPNLTDVIVNLRGKCGTLYGNTTTHYSPYAKNGNGRALGCTSRNINQCHSIVVDVDNFPLSGYETEYDKLDAIYENYGFLKKYKPTFITDTGKKGFQVFYCFKQNIAGDNYLKRFLTGIITFAIDGDPCSVKTVGQYRMPYSTRADGDDCKLIQWYGDIYNYKTFSKALTKYSKEMVITYDGQVAKRWQVWKDDIIGNIADFVCMQHNIHPIINKVSKKPDVRPIDYKVHDKREKKYSFLVNRRLDLEEVMYNKSGNLYGCRNNFLYDYGVATWLTICQKGNRKDAEDEFRKRMNIINKRFTEPLANSELQSTIRSVMKQPMVRSDAKLDLMYGMSHINGMRNAYTPEGKYRRKKAYEKEKYAPIKKENAKKKEHKIIQFIKEAAKGYNPTQLSKIMSWSRTTVYKYLKRFGKIIDLLKKKASCGKYVEGAVHTRLKKPDEVFIILQEKAYSSA